MSLNNFRRKKKRLGDLLVDAGVITEEQLMEGLSAQKQKGTKLGETLIDLGYINEYQIADALHLQLGYDVVDLSEIQIEDGILGLVSDPILRKHMMIPFEFKENNPNVLRVAMSNPLLVMWPKRLINIMEMQRHRQ